MGEVKARRQIREARIGNSQLRAPARLSRLRKLVTHAALITAVLVPAGIAPLTSEAASTHSKHSAVSPKSTTQAAITFFPTSLSFNTTVGQTDLQTVTLTNSGTATLQLNSATVSGTGFGLSGLTLPTTVSAGQSVSFVVRFAPTSTATVSGRVAFSDNAPASPQAFPLTGTATGATVSLSASSGDLNFGNVQTGSSTSLTTTLTDTGNSQVTISGITLTGLGYSTSGVTSGLILSPNQSVSLTVTFAPTALGGALGSISIASNATNSPVTILLSGESHTVMLSWGASASSGVTGYYVYRETSSGSYTKLNSSSLVASTQYTDTTVQAGTTYSYVVTTVDSTGAESSYSSPTTVTIP